MTPMNTILQAGYSIELLRAYLESYLHQSHLEVIFATHSKTFLSMHHRSVVRHGPSLHFRSSTLRIPPLRLSLYALCSCTYIMVGMGMAGNDLKVFTELFIGHSTSTIEVDVAPSPTLTTGVDSAPSPTPTAEVDSVPSPTPTAEVNSAPDQVSKTVVDSVSGPVSNTVVDSASGLASEIVVDSVTSPASKKAVDSASGHHPALKTAVNPTPRPAPKTAVDSEAAQKTGVDEVDPIWGMWGQEPWACEAQYNSQLENATEFDKAGSSSASTIMALLPALLAFAPIVTAKIGLLHNLSLSHGFIAAAFTFGLPVQQLEVMTTRSVTSVKRLLGNVEDDLSRCGTAGDSIPSTNQSVSPKYATTF